MTAAGDGRGDGCGRDEHERYCRWLAGQAEIDEDADAEEDRQPQRGASTLDFSFEGGAEPAAEAQKQIAQAQRQPRPAEIAIDGRPLRCLVGAVADLLIGHGSTPSPILGQLGVNCLARRPGGLTRPLSVPRGRM